MKRWVKIVVLILALAILLAAGAALYKHFITDSIMDKGGKIGRASCRERV